MKYLNVTFSVGNSDNFANLLKSSNRTENEGQVYSEIKTQTPNFSNISNWILCKCSVWSQTFCDKTQIKRDSAEIMQGLAIIELKFFLQYPRIELWNDEWRKFYCHNYFRIESQWELEIGTDQI